MAFLLDTHTMIWYFNGDEMLSPKARFILDSDSVEKYLSIASVWEIAVKSSIGKLKLNYDHPELLRKLNLNSIKLLPVSFEHTSNLLHLPLHHRDPFHRMLIAQALTDNLTLITKDKNFSLYPAQLLWN